MSLSLRDRLIAALKDCPCCNWDRVRIHTSEDGIPGDCVHESVFRCGAAAFVTEDDTYRVSTSCPNALDEELDELQDRVGEEFENEEGDEP